MADISSGKNKPTMKEMVSSAKSVLRFARAIVAGLESFFSVYGEDETTSSELNVK